MSSSWWADRLSKPVTPPPPSTPPTTQYPQQPVYVPPAQPQYVPQTHQAYPPTTAPQPPLRPGEQQQRLLDPRRAPTEQIPMGEAIHLWKGGEAHRKEGDWHCPECGSQHFFSRSKGGGVAGKAPAPRCFECGYTGLYTQGDQANWAV